MAFFVDRPSVVPKGLQCGFVDRPSVVPKGRQCHADRVKGDHDMFNHTPTASVESSSLTPKGKNIIPRQRHDVELEKLHHQQHVQETDRANVVNNFSRSPGLVQNLSPQPVERLHKVQTETPHGKHQCPTGVEGFSKMGTTTNEEPMGRHSTSKREYDPKRLAFPLVGERQGEPMVGIHGLKNTQNSVLRHQNSVANYKTGQGSPSDIQGFAGVKSQGPPEKHAKKERPDQKKSEINPIAPPPTTNLAKHCPYTLSPQVINGFQGMGRRELSGNPGGGLKTVSPPNQKGEKYPNFQCAYEAPMQQGMPQATPSGANRPAHRSPQERALLGARRTHSSMLP